MPNSVPPALIALIATLAAGAVVIAWQLRIASRSTSMPAIGGTIPSIATVIAAPWVPDGELTLTILDLAIVLLGRTARSRRPVRMWVARQFISRTRPSVVPSMLIQSPAR